MKKKYTFGAALTTILFGVVISGSAQLSTGLDPTSNFTTKANRSLPLKAAQYDESSFNDSVELSRKELLVDVQSVTSTPASKSATIAFNSSRLVGWATPKRNAFIIIDDDDYSGSPSNPSLSGVTQPVFNGYTVEMVYIETFTLSYGSGADKVERKEIVIPEMITYGDSFAVENNKIAKDAFIFTDADHAKGQDEKTRIERIIIPKGIDVIEAGAFQNVPDTVSFYCEAESQAAAGWEDGWCDALPENIHFGYTLIGQETTGKKTGNETNQVTQTTGSGEQYYGDLARVATDSTGTIDVIIDDPNWTGDFSDPAKTGTAPFEFNGYVYRIDDSSANPDIVIPEKVTYGDITINVTRVPADVIQFDYKKINNYTITSSVTTLTATVDGATFEAKLPDAKSKTNFTYQVRADASSTGWYTSSKLVDLAEYGITVTGEPKHGNYVTVNKTTTTNYVGNVQSISIPEGIVEVENGAFKDVPSAVQINCEYTPESSSIKKQPYWGDNWISGAKDEQIHWGSTISESKKNITAASVNREYRLSNEAQTYILGYKYTRVNKYYCKAEAKYYTLEELHDGKSPKGNPVQLVEDKTPEFNLPLVISYDVLNASTHAKIRTVYKEMPLLSEEPTSNIDSYFDSVKSSIFTRTVDILLEEGEELDEESFGVHNIFRAKFIKSEVPVVNDDGDVVEAVRTFVIPDQTVNFSSKIEKRFDKEIGINEVIKYRYKEISSFTDHFVTTMEIDKVLPSYWYQGVGPDIVSEYIDFLDSGEYSIRYALYDLQGSFYRLTYYSPTKGANVTTTFDINTPNGVVILDKNTANRVSFIVNNNDVFYKEGGKTIRDFKVENLRQFEIIGLTVNIHLWNNAASTKVGRTDLSMHFGAVDVMPFNAKGPQVFNVGTFVIIFAIAFTVAYAAIAVALFFFLRNKYKNDEFRRMRPKQYIKTAVLGYFGSIVVALTLVFIIFRATMFSNSVAAHNPIDAFIVVPGVISIVVIGYFIKFIIGKVKANNKRKEIQKLKLNEDTKDDGTN